MVGKYILWCSILIGFIRYGVIIFLAILSLLSLKVNYFAQYKNTSAKK
ncbi:Uncharacterised protein [uncultured Prevotella sp.]|nr:Uncharacterised protein [uncultured Prevotella sp.]